jgi:hypothetical protein
MNLGNEVGVAVLFCNHLASSAIITMATLKLQVSHKPPPATCNLNLATTEHSANLVDQQLRTTVREQPA